VSGEALTTIDNVARCATCPPLANTLEQLNAGVDAVERLEAVPEA